MSTTLLETAIFRVEIRSASVSINEDNLSYAAAQALVQKTRQENAADAGLVQQIDYCTPSFGFMGYSGRDYTVNISARRERTGTGEMQTCAARKGTQYEGTENADEWQLVGDDQVCSFCGSLKPSRLIELIREKGLGIVDGSIKAYKWYVLRPEVPNAAFGGIKYYLWHNTPEFVEQFNALIYPKQES
jgi:hypothetical protein